MKLNKTFALICCMTLMFSGCVSVQQPDNSSDESQTGDGTTTGDQTTTEFQDKSYRPQDDFYGYVNFDKIKDMEIDYGKSSAGSFDDISYEIEDNLKEAGRKLVQSNENYKKGSAEQLIHDIALQAYNYKDNGEVLKITQDMLDKINSTEDINQLIELAMEFYNQYNVPFFFGDMISIQKDKTTRNNAVYISHIQLDEDSFSSNGGLQDLHDSIKNDYLMVEPDKEKAYEKSKEYVYLQMDIANSTDFSIEYNDNPMETFEFISNEELGKLFSNLNTDLVKLFFGKENPNDGVYIQDKPQLEKLNSLLTNENLEKFKVYMCLHVIANFRDYIADEVDCLKQYAADPNDEDAKEENVSSIIQQLLPNEVGKIYLDNYYTEERDRQLLKLCDDIKESYRELITNCDSLSDKTKEGFIQKLDNIEFLTGDKLCITDPEYADLIGKDFFETQNNISSYERQKKVDSLGKEYDPASAQTMQPHVMNACYVPDINKIAITAAITNSPFFDEKADYYTNLGGLGMVIAHEMGHAFDANCLNYDADGNYRPEWIDENDRKVIEKQMQEFIDYYNNFKILDVYHVDGELTIGENFADVGGMECITNIAKNKEDLEKLFENFATIWCGVSINSNAIEMLKLDVHSPDRIRVNAVLSSCEKFYETYDVKEGDKMYVSPDKRIRRW